MKYLVSFLLVCSLTQTFGQTDSACTPMLDTVSVIKITNAKKFNNGNEQRSFNIYFDPYNCEWCLVTSQVNYIHHGPCKGLNGCTEIVEVVYLVDDRTKKVKSKTREKKLYPHYE
jgi:hypothetical protein